MKTSQKLSLRASEIRQRLNEIAGLEGDALTDEIRAESDKLTGEYRDVETRHRAAIVAEGDELKEAETRGAGPDAPDAETRAFLELRSRTRFGRFLECFRDGEQLTGAEKELAEHRGLTTAGNVVPWDALLPPPAPPAELRADAVTPAPGSGNPINQSEIIQRVFARSGTARLGVYMPSVGVGQASYPVITAGQAGAFAAADGAVEAAAGTIAPNALSPVRLQARFMFRLEDSMLTMGLESGLREDAVMALADRLDKQLLGLGDANVRGFLATAANGGIGNVTAASTEVDYAAAVTEAAKGVDGIYAGSESECSWVLGVATYRKLASLIQTNGDVSAVERARRVLRDLMASANIPAAASDVQQGIIAKLGAPGAMNAVCPIWEGLKLIRDEVTNAAKGQILVTAVALHNFKVLRAAGFQRTSLKLA